MEITAMCDLMEGIEMGFFDDVNGVLKWIKSHGIEKEKQQILDAYWGGLNGSMNDWSEAKVEGPFVKGIKVAGGAEQYYNERFS
jgi:hypothetical protein